MNTRKNMTMIDFTNMTELQSDATRLILAAEGSIEEGVIRAFLAGFLAATDYPLSHSAEGLEKAFFDWWYIA